MGRGEVPAAIAPNEDQRLAELRRLDVLDTPVEDAFDRLTRIAAAHFQVPIALVSLVDSERQWFKSVIGLQVRETSRDVAFCAHAILDREVLVVEDAQADIRFANNPLVQEDPNIRFYAGAPLVTDAGFALGTLCVIDRKPRTLAQPERRLLQDLAALAVLLLEQRQLGQDMAQAQARERQALEQFRSFFQAAPLPMYRLNSEGLVRAWNPAAERFLGWSEAEILGKFHPLVPPDRRDEFESLRRSMMAKPEPVVGLRRVRQKKDGTKVVVSLSVSPLCDDQGQLVEFLGIVEDITEREHAAAQLIAAESEARRLQEEMLRVERELSRIDPLTGLGNRRACEEAYSRETARAERSGRPLCVALFDLDHFKRHNDSQGHASGDAMLRLFAVVIKESVRGVDQAVRWGGEEFLLLMPDTELGPAQDVANRIREVFALRATGAGEPMTVSGGVAQRQWGEDLGALVARADIGLYAAKAEGRNRVR